MSNRPSSRRADFRTITAAVASVLVLASCGDSLSSFISVAGNWTEVSTTPGSSLDMSLDVVRDSVTGSGVRHREALSSVNYSVNGHFLYPTFALTFHFDDGTTATYNGNITREPQLVGTLTSEGVDSTSVTFKRP
jgi:hypothetical protein